MEGGDLSGGENHEGFSGLEVFDGASHAGYISSVPGIEGVYGEEELVQGVYFGKEEVSEELHVRSYFGDEHHKQESVEGAMGVVGDHDEGACFREQVFEFSGISDGGYLELVEDILRKIDAGSGLGISVESVDFIDAEEGLCGFDDGFIQQCGIRDAEVGIID